jgi:hypothetical protein
MSFKLALVDWGIPALASIRFIVLELIAVCDAK